LFTGSGAETAALRTLFAAGFDAASGASGASTALAVLGAAFDLDLVARFEGVSRLDSGMAKRKRKGS
jgi:hypothetical protein